jgi:hypothetical protein
LVLRVLSVVIEIACLSVVTKSSAGLPESAGRIRHRLG